MKSPKIRFNQSRRRFLARHGVHGRENVELIVSMLLSARAKEGVLSGWMGLPAGDFAALTRYYFRRLPVQGGIRRGAPYPDGRMPEWDDLYRLLVNNRGPKDRSGRWLARIVCNACMGQNHLWQDLGLWSRGELTRLMYGAFPALARRNVHDMKWKKFLYKQLCQMEGVYICRAPSCDVCVDYPVCFGPEQ
ncbi:nitrogen fixation protein NifQ [Varunaivibrio sulfuroxidans]|uniref:Nitrogen fixation protein NifQ n=1 Tax=Varunaivibrio sulfuroxidans TaxID=1773489 RepID=A0A4R3J9P5_9PROT|nr:nitrogen fixation protein NifQ [Varunaivibrio sulfuroxidans]TCS61736.1 nitrogen fixation protein NifQ [Varunaivibrio sulfuroxidans]WES32079.1 nitrogen fixation protein NifQ [Varunaivibrio sulfuroxidans]